MAAEGVFVVRLGAMGDVLHAMPAVAALAERAPVTWIIKPQWTPLIAGSRQVASIVTNWRDLARGEFATALDFQGLIKSALIARWAARRVIGFDSPREAPARWIYSEARPREGAHVVDQNLRLAGVSARAFDMPMGRPEGRLPAGPFVLASPLAGWRSKQWPIGYYQRLASLLPIPLVLNGPPGSGFEHESTLEGLIDATRRATAVVGVDSGPLHLAAALAKPGVAIFGPTDPARNGPYGTARMRVLRDASAVTSYKRRDEIDRSMRAITPEMAAAALMEAIG